MFFEKMGSNMDRSDPDGYRWPPTFPTGSKQFSDIFGNLLFLAVFRVLNFWSHFEALKDIFLGYVVIFPTGYHMPKMEIICKSYDFRKLMY